MTKTAGAFPTDCHNVTAMKRKFATCFYKKSVVQLNKMYGSL